jgi:hypothetical protein
MRCNGSQLDEEGHPLGHGIPAAAKMAARVHVLNHVATSWGPEQSWALKRWASPTQ